MLSSILKTSLYTSLLLVGVATVPVLGAEPTKASSVVGTRVVDISGKLHRLGMEDGARPHALVFLDTGCPIANRFAPHLNQLHSEAEELGIALYGVLSDPLISLPEAREFHEKYDLKYPLIWDSVGDLAMRLEPTHVPEAFVVDANGKVLYRGRIDNRFVSIGRLRATITSHDLQDAITAAASGRRPIHAQQPPVGCMFEAWDGGLPEKIDYARHVAPIVNANCVECHRQGGIGPFALENYQQTKRRAGMSAIVCEERLMPPWKAEPGFGHFQAERILSDRQISVLTQWNESGKAEGSSAEMLPPPPLPRGDWRMGQPDMVLKMPEPFEVPAEGKDVYRYFVISNPLPEDVVIVAMDFKPGDPTVVHHMNSFVDYAGRGRELDAEDQPPGFSVFGTGGFIDYDATGEDGSAALGGWTPGMEPYRLPPDHGIYLQKGGEVVIEIHYHLSGRATQDQSSLALYFAKKPVRKYLDGLVIGTQDMNISPGDANYERHFWMETPANLTLVDVMPHMHYLGTSAKVVATLPDGEEVPLVNISDWDFRWQSIYTFRKPQFLPKGSRIDAWFTWDNSADNPDNPTEGKQSIKWGWETNDEMAEVWMGFVPERFADSEKIHSAGYASWLRTGDPLLSTQTLSAEQMVEQFLEASLWEPAGEQLLGLVASSEEFEKVLNRVSSITRRDPRNTSAWVVYGTLLAMSIEYASSDNEAYQISMEADRAYNQALRLEPKNWDAQMSKAAYYAQSDYQPWERQAVRLLEKIIQEQEAQKRQPSHAKAYLELGNLYAKQQKSPQAKDAYRRGLKRFPTNAELKSKLNP
ncbi:MAG: redoxin domain-containing protein [Planctomycetota bacterium]